jgi:ribose 5-phosphate isomerase A
MDDADRMRAIGEAAAAEVPDEATVGLGTGSTANAMLHALAARVRDGLRVTGVTTSEATARLCAELGIPVTELDRVDALDLGIDGADEIDPQLNLVKGRGGALLYEKLVAERTNRFIAIGSSEKLVTQLGTRLPLPVEIIPVGHVHTMRTLAAMGLVPTLRLLDDSSPFVTDGGHYIADCATGPIGDAARLGAAIKALTGVVDHGLFVGIASMAITIDSDGVLARHMPRQS